MMHTITATCTGLLISLGLFYFMAILISRGHKIPEATDVENVINFVRTALVTPTATRQRTLPKEPPPPDSPPRLQNVATNTPVAPTSVQMNIAAPKLDLAFDGAQGPYLGEAAAASGNQDVVPIVRIEPQYPRQAAMAAQQGWVKLKFDITEMGTVDNVEVVDAEPSRVFDSSARQALLKWKYKPKTVDGKTVAQIGNLVQIDFKLE